MYISYVKICNFRNFRETEVFLGQNAVIVGENAVGKSNFLEAIRLVLDSSLPDRERQLQEDDFWNGDVENYPPFRGNCIEITIKMKGLDTNLISVLYDQTVPAPSGSTSGEEAEISYRYEPNPKSTKDPKLTTRSDYTFNFYRRTNQQSLLEAGWIKSHSPIKSMVEFRKRITFMVIPALRDIENSLNAWKRSPLKELVDRLKLEDDEEFGKIVDELKSTTISLRKIESVRELEKDIKERITKMFKGLYNIDPCLSIAPTSANKLAQSLRMALGESEMSPLGATSLGIANVLFLSLLSLQAEKKRDNDSEYVILGIEEPEAHLHPHLQRLIFRDFFNVSKTVNQPVMMTTHSPHIASVSPLNSLTLIKNNRPNGSKVSSTANLLNVISPEENNDLERYLDVSRSEILFARGVILVEGIAEQYMLPTLFKTMKPEDLGIDQSRIENEQINFNDISLEQFGITICNINGVAFKAYAQFLRNIDIPFIVLTDGDPVKEENGNISLAGIVRGYEIAKAVFPDEETINLKDSYSKGKNREAQMFLEELGIFVNRSTLEAELILSCYSSTFEEIFTEFGAGSKMRESLKASLNKFISLNGNGVEAVDSLEYILTAIERYPCFGKGRFAQVLSTKSVPGVPSYISKGFKFLVSRVVAQGG